ncbi:uncharacterized protein C8Q71DRAFT_277681 [Rhodofomes roseus]|uniref:C2H2-type domain-containing protein n=1 Tax=Rhodofomes roseus TaxID=34475 RepID=A0ABQ8K5I2_9APHY|nr:uncharacterized protein C8Q71DRAFT_277681 [Rhodofomes roseus]KAH9832017.1 hypothetical protein C8Q71DRAFT_277681 [Rhodofomes roseus]
MPPIDARGSGRERDECALIVWLDDLNRVAQGFLDIEHRLRHAVHLCECISMPSSATLRSLSEPESAISLADDFLFAPYHSFDDPPASTHPYDLPTLELPELDLPFRPLEAASSTEGDILNEDDSMTVGLASIDAQPRRNMVGVRPTIFHPGLGCELAPSSLLPGNVFTSRSEYARSAPSHETEPQTISPSLLHSPHSSYSTTLSPASTSGELLTPWSAAPNTLPVWTTPSELQISPTSTIDVASIAPAPKMLDAGSSDADPHYPRAQSPRTVSPCPDASTVLGRKRKRGAAETTEIPMAREVKPLPKRRANRMADVASPAARLYPMPGRTMPMTRSRRGRTVEEPPSAGPSTTRRADVDDGDAESMDDAQSVGGDVSDGDDEYRPIDMVVVDEDDTDYEPKPKKGRVDAGTSGETRAVAASSKRSVTKRSKRRRGAGALTPGGSRRGRFPCHLCDKVLTRKTDLDRHVDTHREHADRGVLCDACRHHYARMDSYKRHLRPDGTCPKAKQDDPIDVDDEGDLTEPESEEDAPSS